MFNTNQSPDPELISFQTIRRAVGWLGILLPPVLVVGSFLFGNDRVIQPSISHYYFTNMREIFVGVLCAVSLFLFTYKGYSKLDGRASNLAGFFSLGVALFPTNVIPDFPAQQDVVSFISISFHNVVHFTCAALFFLTLAFISLYLFTRSKHMRREDQTPQKRTRNVVYKLCGWIMIGSLVTIAFSAFMNVDKTNQVTFWFETLALLAFGISWLTKGEALFGDKQSPIDKP